jgi:hypothetical protein
MQWSPEQTRTWRAISYGRLPLDPSPLIFPRDRAGKPHYRTVYTLSSARLVSLLTISSRHVDAHRLCGRTSQDRQQHCSPGISAADCLVTKSDLLVNPPEPLEYVHQTQSEQERPVEPTRPGPQHNPTSHRAEASRQSQSRGASKWPIGTCSGHPSKHAPEEPSVTAGSPSTRVP